MIGNLRRAEFYPGSFLPDAYSLSPLYSRVFQIPVERRLYLLGGVAEVYSFLQPIKLLIPDAVREANICQFFSGREMHKKTFTKMEDLINVDKEVVDLHHRSSSFTCFHETTKVVDLSNVHIINFKLESGLLRELSLTSVDVLSITGEWPNLETLDIHLCENITDIHINAPNLQKACFGNNTSLKKISFSNVDKLERFLITKCKINISFRAPCLRNMEIYNSDIEEFNVQAPNLKNLRIFFTVVKDFKFFYDKLETLNFGCSNPLFGILIEPARSYLKVLTIENAKIESIKGDYPLLQKLVVNSCKNLKDININAANLKNVTFNYSNIETFNFGNTWNLTDLSISHCNKITKFVFTAPLLENLIIVSCVGATQFNVVAPELRNLDIKSSVFTESFTSDKLELLTLTSIENIKLELRLAKCIQIEIKYCSNLKQINLKSPELRLVTYYRNPKLTMVKLDAENLQNLSVTYCPISRLDFNTEHLVFLSLDSTELQNERIIFVLLTKNPNLRSVSLESAIKDENENSYRRVLPHLVLKVETVHGHNFSYLYSRVFHIPLERRLYLYSLLTGVPEVYPDSFLQPIKLLVPDAVRLRHICPFFAGSEMDTMREWISTL